MHTNSPETQEFELAVDESKLPDLIHGQIGKLNELDKGVKSALDAAEKAEQSAMEARKLSADRGIFTDKKKEAIEGLQKAGIELAQAVQSGSKAQKLSFELQTRFAEITKYLFTLGVRNIAANRIVVRELEMRLRGASEEELSDLARQELMSVIRQLKEQEDLLRKQEQMRETLRGQEVKIRHLLAQTDDLALSIENQDGQQRTLVGAITSMGQVAEQQEGEIASLRKDAFSLQTELESLNSALADARSHAETSTANLLARTEAIELRLDDQDVRQHALSALLDSVEQISKSQQQEISTVQQQLLTQQTELERLATALIRADSYAEQVTASLRSTLNVRTALLIVFAIAVPTALHFLP